MKVVVGYPPMYDEIAAAFEISPRAIFAWGDIIYNPSKGRVSKDLIAHEEVHMEQQAGEPVRWWKRYIAEDQFRLDQEVEAYRRQYQFLCSQNRNRNYQFQVLAAMALLLSGPMYGYLTSQSNAMELIK